MRFTLLYVMVFYKDDIFPGLAGRQLCRGNIEKSREKQRLFC